MTIKFPFFDQSVDISIHYSNVQDKPKRPIHNR